MIRQYTEQQKIEIYNNPVRIEMMPHDKMTKAEQDELQNTLKRLMLIGADLADSAKNEWIDLNRVKTKYFKNFNDYLVCRENIGWKIACGESVDPEIEKRLQLETAWLKESKQPY